MHEREYNRLRAVIEAEYHKKLDALDLVYRMAGRNGMSASPLSVKGEIAQAVIGVLEQMKNEFNVRDIEASLRISHPSVIFKRASLSNTLKRLEGREVEVIEKGSGKRPSKYRRKVKGS